MAEVWSSTIHHHKTQKTYADITKNKTSHTTQSIQSQPSPLRLAASHLKIVTKMMRELEIPLRFPDVCTEEEVFIFQHDIQQLHTNNDINQRRLYITRNDSGPTPNEDDK